MAGPAAQRPLELILARNLLSSLSTPALLVNRPGDVIFYNEAAGALLGRRFEDTGSMSASEWTAIFGPLDDSGRPIPIERAPLTPALRANRAAHLPHVIRSATGTLHHIEVSGVPIMGSGGFQGAMLFFWPRSRASAPRTAPAAAERTARREAQGLGRARLDPRPRAGDDALRRQHVVRPGDARRRQHARPRRRDRHPQPGPDARARRGRRCTSC